MYIILYRYPDICIYIFNTGVYTKLYILATSTIVYIILRIVIYIRIVRITIVYIYAINIIH